MGGHVIIVSTYAIVSFKSWMLEISLWRLVRGHKEEIVSHALFCVLEPRAYGLICFLGCGIMLLSYLNVWIFGGCFLVGWLMRSWLGLILPPGQFGTVIIIRLVLSPRFFFCGGVVWLDWGICRWIQLFY